MLNDFQSEGREDDILQLNFKVFKVLMTGELGEDMLVLCKNGGMNYIFTIIFLFIYFLRDIGVFKSCYNQEEI